MKSKQKKDRSLFKTRDQWLKTTRSTLLADKLATVFITVVGFGSIVTLFGILFFLVQTVWPLFKPESVDLSFSTKPASTENRVFVDDEFPLGLVQRKENNGCHFQSVLLTENRTIADWYLQVSQGSLTFSPRQNSDSNLAGTHCISQSDESILVYTERGWLAGRIEFSYDALSTEEIKSLSKEVLADLKNKHYGTHLESILTQSSSASLISHWRPISQHIGFFDGAFLTSYPWFQEAVSEGRIEIRTQSEQIRIVTAKSKNNRQSIENVVIERENKNPMTEETTRQSVSLTIAEPFKENLSGVELIDNRNVWLMSAQGNMARIVLPDVLPDNLIVGQENLIFFPESKNFSFVRRIFGGDSIFIVDDKIQKCFLIDAGLYARRATNAASESPALPQPTLTATWGIDCPKNIKFVQAHPKARVVFLLTDAALVGFEITTHRKLFETPLASIVNIPIGAIDDLHISKFGQYLKFYHDKIVDVVKFNAPHLDSSFSSYFSRVQYEGYEKREFVWQSTSGSEDFQPKFSMMPLIWGTLKATFYAILFAGPIGIFAAIYTSEFLDRNSRNIVKPTVELMASVPSVVLGFLAAIVIAPWVERHVASVLLAGLTTPFLMFLFGNLLSTLSARYISRRGLYASRLLLLWLVLGCLSCFIVTAKIGEFIEQTAFGGDIKDFISGGPGSEAALWAILLLPLVLIALWSLPIRRYVKTFKIIAFCLAPVLSFSFGLYFATGGLLRNSVMATYAQRNTLVISIAMGFAIIPIIYSIAEDALSAVPSSLRAGSLACGASVWQTTAHVVVPTAASGIFSALMIGIGRAVGETMIVVMATGNTPVIGINPFEGLRSLAANIAVELPEAPYGGTHYRTLFLSALLLFFFTFILNSIAEVLRYRIRQRIKAL